MKVLLAGDHRRMPWKNGGGETLEVAISPPGAGIEAFDWRVSMAVVAFDGAFSAFPGTDRTLVVLEGEGMALAIDGRNQVQLTPTSAPCAFRGDVATTAKLTAGPITDLNVMTARGRYAHAVERLAAQRDMRAGPLETLLILGDGATADAVAHSVTLGPRDVVMLKSGETAHVRPAALAMYLLVTIQPID